MPDRTRRSVLAGLSATATTLGLAGCVAGPLPGTGVRPDRTLYVGAYHWGFVVLDGDGTEHESVVLDPGTRLRLVAFNTSAESAVDRLPEAVRSALPDHEGLEGRNEGRIPEPLDGDMHEALEEANERYPDHSVAVVPSGAHAMRGPMGGGMMLHPVPLPRAAPRPAVAGLVATQRGDYTLSCLTYCGDGHPFMELEEAFVVR